MLKKISKVMFLLSVCLICIYCGIQQVYASETGQKDATHEVYNLKCQPDNPKWQNYFKKKLKKMKIDSPVFIRESYVVDWDGQKMEIVVASNVIVSKNEKLYQADGTSVEQTLPSNKRCAVYTMSAVFGENSAVVDVFSDVRYLSKSRKEFSGSRSGISFYQPTKKGTYYQKYISVIQKDERGKLKRYRLFFNMTGELLLREYKYFPKFKMHDVDGDGMKELVAYHDGSGSLCQYSYVYKLVDDVPVKMDVEM